MSAGNETTEIAGLILAGGLSRRLGGGDKSLLQAGGRTLLEHVIARARPQVGFLLLSANGDPSRFAAYGLPVVADRHGDHWGPLAGILSALLHLRDFHPGIGWLASFAADTPYPPPDLVCRLHRSVTESGARMAGASSGGRRQPVFGLWPVALADDLEKALVADGLRKVEAWTARYHLATVDWPWGDADPFFNVNTPEDLAHVRSRENGDG